MTTIRDYEDVSRVYQWLNSGQHHFKSVVLDSATEIQKRCIDNIAGRAQPTQQQWGSILREMEGLIRQFRDLRVHPQNPLTTVTYVLGSNPTDTAQRPLVQGQLRLTLPYYMDVVGYLFTEFSADGALARRLMVQPMPGIVAKDRTGRLGQIVDQPHIEHMLGAIYGRE